MLYFIGLGLAFLAGGLGAFLILRKNPKLLKLEQLTRDQLLELNKKIGMILK